MLAEMGRTDDAVRELGYALEIDPTYPNGFLKRGMLRMVEKEQALPRGRQRMMSTVLWDSFTGSAPYRDIFLRTLKPSFFLGLALETLKTLLSRRPDETRSLGSRP